MLLRPARWLVAHIIDELTSPDAEVCSNAVMLLGDQSSAVGAVAAAIAKDMLISGRWRQAAYVDLQVSTGVMLWHTHDNDQFWMRACTFISSDGPVVT